MCPHKSGPNGGDAMIAQHLQLDALRAELIDGFRLGVSGNQFAVLCTRFRTALAGHFASEEAALAEAGFSGLSQHAELHREILAKLDDALDATNANSSSQTRYAFIEAIETWLYQHELVDDGSYAGKISYRDLR